jgi:rhodanese-related sulfurtransferase
MERYLEFAGNHTLLVVALLASFFLAVYAELRRKARSVFDLDATSSVALINQGAAVIDLRSQDAFSRGHIVGARNVPMADLDARRDLIEKLRDNPILLVCDQGNSSVRAAVSLRKAGFDKVFSLKSGMTAWQAAGLPVISGRKKGKKNQ